MSYNPGSTGFKSALTGSTSGTISFTAAATTTSYSLIWPSAQGSGSLINDGAGNLSWEGTFGTVTSVALSLPGSVFSVSGSPVTGAGTLTGTFATQSANTVFAGPVSGGAATPTFRSLVSADIPNNAANTTGTAANITASSNSTLTTLSALSLPGAQVTGNISGTASNITATSNSTLTTLSSLSLPANQLTGTLQAAQFPALTGDITTTAGSLATTLATVNSNVGTFGSSTSIPTFTVNGKGLITAASGNAVIAPAGTLSGTTLNSTVVSSSLTSVGTITSGVWNGTTIAVANGGTGTTTSTGSGSVVLSTSPTFTTSIFTPAVITTEANPATSGFIRLANNGNGIVFRNAANTGNIALNVDGSNELTYNGAEIFSPGGVLTSTAFPALTGDVTTSAGSLVTSLVATSNGTLATLSGLTTVSSATSFTAASTALTVTNEMRAAGIGIGNAGLVGTLRIGPNSFTAGAAIDVSGNQAYTGATTEYGVRSEPNFTTSVTNSAQAFSAAPSTANYGSPQTIPYVANYVSRLFSAGTNATITNGIEFLSSDAFGASQIQATNTAVLADNNTFTGNWFVNQSSSKASTFGGVVTFTANSVGLRVIPSTGTGGAYANFANTGGTFSVGLDNSTGSNVGAGNYGGFIQSPTTLDLFVNAASSAVKAVAIDTSGNVSIPNGSLTISSLTSGSVLFAGASGLISQDNSKFFWDDTNLGLRLGTNSTITSSGKEALTSVLALTSIPAANSQSVSISSKLTSTSVNNISFSGIRLIAERSSSTTVSDTGGLFGVIITLDFDIASGQTLTVPTSVGATSSAIRIASSNISGGGSVTGNYASLAISSDSQTFTGTKVAAFINGMSGGTNNAFIADNLGFSGNWFINSSSSNNSTFGGNVTVTSDLLIKGSSSGTVTINASSGTYNYNLPITAGTAGQVLTSQGGSSTAMTWTTLSAGVSFVAPTVQTFTSGSGTYTTPTSPAPLYIKVTVVGGGGGGSGSGPTSSTGTAGGAGGNTTFGSSLLTANGGAGGPAQVSGTIAAGGTATVNSPAIQIEAFPGQNGSGSQIDPSGVSTSLAGGPGGNSPFFNGAGGFPNSTTGVSAAATPNTGGGGGGGLTNVASVQSGTGGAGGAGIIAIIKSPSSTYSYSIGTAGAGGALGSSGFTGGNGSAGIIIVEEYYQ